jgi:hypothetical protein
MMFFSNGFSSQIEDGAECGQENYWKSASSHLHRHALDQEIRNETFQIQHLPHPYHPNQVQ